MDDQALRKRRKKRLVAILVMHFHMQVQHTILMMMLLAFFAILVEILNKKKTRKRRKLCDSHGRQLVSYEGDSDDSDEDDDDTISGDSLSKLADTLAEIAAMIRSFSKKQSESIRELVSCFEHEKVMEERRMKLPELLREIDGLTAEERMKACIIIGRNENLTDFIFSLEPEERLVLVSQVLSESS